MKMIIFGMLFLILTSISSISDAYTLKGIDGGYKFGEPVDTPLHIPSDDISCQNLGYDCYDVREDRCVEIGEIRPMSPALLEDLHVATGGKSEEEIRRYIYPMLVGNFLRAYMRDPNAINSKRLFTVVAYTCEETDTLE